MARFSAPMACHPNGLGSELGNSFDWVEVFGSLMCK
jgi:hypothetical protein